jgi:hypothetical protein
MWALRSETVPAAALSGSLQTRVALFPTLPTVSVFPPGAFRGNGNRTAQEQRIDELRRGVKQFEEEREILKKRQPTSPFTSGEV